MPKFFPQNFPVSLISGEFPYRYKLISMHLFFPQNSAEFRATLGKLKENNDCTEISWPVSYMTSYTCLYMYWSYHACFINNSQLKIQWLWFDFPMLSNVRSYKINWKIRYDLLYLFHSTLTIRLTFMRCN